MNLSGQQTSMRMGCLLFFEFGDKKGHGPGWRCAHSARFLLGSGESLPLAGKAYNYKNTNGVM